MDEKDPQVVETESKVAVAGAEPQPETEPKVIQPGVQPSTLPTPPLRRTYSEEEFSQQMGKFQAETAQAREVVNRLAMEHQIRLAQEAEQKLVAKDQQDVEQGLITESDAGQRKALRDQTAQLQQGAAQLQQFVQQQATQGEALGRILMAQDLAKEYGVNVDDLLNGKELTTPLQMVTKAAKLAIAKLKEEAKKPETFIAGPGLGVDTGEDMSKLSARELARRAYARK